VRLTPLQIVLIAVSFQTVELNTVGLNVNNNLVTVDSTQVYPPGRYFVGLGHGFLSFPTSVQESQQDITCRSLDGMMLTLTFSYQWQLNSDVTSIYGLWSKFSDDIDDYQTAFDKVASETVRNVAAEYSSIQFFFNRSEITTTMGTAMGSALDTLGATVPSFQLLDFELPQAFSDALTSTQNVRSMVTRVLTQQQQAAIQASQSVATAQQSASIVIVNAQAQAQAYVLQKQAERNSTLLTFDAARESYGNLKSQLNLTSDELLAIIWLDALEAGSAAQVVGVPAPSQLCQ
jgi:regulator of protease activity HflC (stomatin/prohibitin superfamily)